MSERREPTSQEREGQRGLQRGEGKRAEGSQVERASLGPRQVAGPWVPHPSSSRHHVALLLSAQQMLGNRVVQRLLQSVVRQEEAVSEREPSPRQIGDEEKVFHDEGISQQDQGRAEATGAPQSPGFMMAREPAPGPGARSWQGLAAEWQARGETETQGQHRVDSYNPMEENLTRLSMGDPFLRVMDGPVIQADKKKGAKKAGKKAGGAVASLPVPGEPHYYSIKGQKTLRGVPYKFLYYNKGTDRREAGQVYWGIVRASETMVSDVQVKNIVWKIDPFTVNLPKWEDYSGASEAAKAEWDRFMGCLRVHEDGHVKICQDGWRAIPPKCKQAKGADIYDLQAKLDKLAIDIHDGIDKDHKDYDTETDHGATQGATLDVNIQ